MFENMAEPVGSGMMGFIYNNVVETICRIFVIMAMQIGCCLHQKVSRVFA